MQAKRKWLCSVNLKAYKLNTGKVSYFDLYYFLTDKVGEIAKSFEITAFKRETVHRVLSVQYAKIKAVNLFCNK